MKPFVQSANTTASIRMVERGNIVDVIEYGEILVDKVYAGYVLDKRDTSLR